MNFLICITKWGLEGVSFQSICYFSIFLLTHEKKWNIFLFITRKLFFFISTIDIIFMFQRNYSEHNLINILLTPKLIKNHFLTSLRWRMTNKLYSKCYVDWDLWRKYSHDAFEKMLSTRNLNLVVPGIIMFSI